MHFDEIISVIS